MQQGMRQAAQREDGGEERRGGINRRMKSESTVREQECNVAKLRANRDQCLVTTALHLRRVVLYGNMTAMHASHVCGQYPLG